MTKIANLIIHLATILAAAMLPTAAFAYVGPGAGLSAIGTVIAVIGAFILLVVGFIWYPIKRMLRKRKPGDTEAEPDRTERNQ